MIVEVNVPVFAESITEGTLLAWHKKAGEAVARDEVLVDIETDKVVLEVPAPQAFRRSPGKSGSGKAPAATAAS